MITAKELKTLNCSVEIAFKQCGRLARKVATWKVKCHKEVGHTRSFGHKSRSYYKVTYICHLKWVMLKDIILSTHLGAYAFV